MGSSSGPAAPHLTPTPWEWFPSPAALRVLPKPLLKNLFLLSWAAFLHLDISCSLLNDIGRNLDHLSSIFASTWIPWKPRDGIRI